VSAAAEPRSTTGAPRVDLEELLQTVRQQLLARDEAPAGSWVEATATDLALGTKPGFYLPGAPGGIVFYARHGPAAFGHLHTDAGPDAARRLAGALLDQLPPDVTSLDLGFTGLAPADEKAVLSDLAARSGSTVIERQAMDRPLAAADARWDPDPPPGLERVPVRAVTLDALTELDRAAFRGTIDELLVGPGPEANRRALEALLEGHLGRFVDEASCALLASEPTRLLGVVLCTERSTRRALVGGLMVDPSERRRGLGRFLLGWSLRALWALGYENARLWVSLDNAAALALYRRFEFRPSLWATIYRWDRPSPQAHLSR
jgi:GNAT superfamily N-acetyltransferase